MKRILWLFLALLALLLAACGSGDEESTSELERDGLEGQAPPVAESNHVDGDGDTVGEAIDATASPAATPEVPTATAEAPASDLSDRLDEMTLDEDDVPRGLSSMGNMTLDYDMETLGLTELGSAKAHMAMFAGPGQMEMVVSMVILLDDAEAVEQALEQTDKLSAEQIQDAFGMMDDFGGLELQDLRVLDVSSLGEDAFGLAMKLEMPQLGVADMQMVFFGRDSVMAMAMTMAMSGGAAADAVPLAEVMDAKIKDVLLD
jgi:hypothetical protein